MIHILFQNNTYSLKLKQFFLIAVYKSRFSKTFKCNILQLFLKTYNYFKQTIMTKKLNIVLIGLFTFLTSYIFAQISTNPNDYLLRLRSDYGYLYGGPNDSLRSYLMTDLPALYINKPLLVNSIGSHTGNLSLFTNTTNISILDSTGYVGIGITNPQAKLHVAGNIRAYEDSITTNYIELKHFANDGIINTVGAGGILFQNNGLNTFSIDNMGRMAVGNITSYPGNYKLFVEGGILTERRSFCTNQ